MGEPIHIAGAGPAGLAAAVNLAKAGYDTMVHKQNSGVGLRFGIAELTLNPSLRKRGTLCSPSLSKRRGRGLSLEIEIKK